jgi:hypothetical protein
VLEDLAGLDAGGAQQPVPHPPRPTVALHDLVDDPPDERQVLMGPGLRGGEVGTALRHLLEGCVDQRVRMAALVLEDHGVEGAAAGVADADADGQAGAG